MITLLVLLSTILSQWQTDNMKSVNLISISRKQSPQNIAANDNIYYIYKHRHTD